MGQGQILMRRTAATLMRSGWQSSANMTTTKQCIKEGSITMYTESDNVQSVFYNPVQQQNRDLSILMICLAGERRALRHAALWQKKQKPAPPLPGLDILDGLAASGLRSLRYWQEIPHVHHVTINDLDETAIQRAYDNVVTNQLQDVVITEAARTTTTRPHGICLQVGDVLTEMYASRGKSDQNNKTEAPSTTIPWRRRHEPPPLPAWDVIDLDPYGSAAMLIHAAVSAVAEHGLLCITCTDMAALGGAHPETAFGRYGSLPLQRAGYLQEMAVRILLCHVARTAALTGRTIYPILSVGLDFYVRIFVQVHTNKAAVQRLSLNTGHVYQSTQCPSFHVVPAAVLGGKNNNVYQAGRFPPGEASPNGLCDETGAGWKVGGPIWLGPLHDVDVVEEAIRRLEQKVFLPHLGTRDRLLGLLHNCRDELPDVPLYYKLPELAQALQMSTPPRQAIVNALVNAGYRVSGYHKEPVALKTDAPPRVVWDVMREYHRQHAGATTPQPNSVAERLRSRAIVTKNIDFSAAAHGRAPVSVARFPMNPLPHWGPKPKAVGQKRKSDSQDKAADTTVTDS
jgi:tRNA (guanine26-N2/guanine27-N2)-dimethyltransferase